MSLFMLISEKEGYSEKGDGHINGDTALECM